VLRRLAKINLNLSPLYLGICIPSRILNDSLEQTGVRYTQNTRELHAQFTGLREREFNFQTEETVLRKGLRRSSEATGRRPESRAKRKAAGSKWLPAALVMV
jgi:hypothetical protein